MRSVLDQAGWVVEYVIVDGESDDGTAEVIAMHKEEAKAELCWIRKPPNGIYAAMNEGLKHCTGKWIGIINADDYYNRDAFARVAEAISKSPSAGLVHGQVLYVEPESCDPIRVSEVQRGLLARMGFGKPAAHPSVFVHQACYANYGV